MSNLLFSISQHNVLCAPNPAKTSGRTYFQRILTFSQFKVSQDVRSRSLIRVECSLTRAIKLRQTRPRRRPDSFMSTTRLFRSSTYSGEQESGKDFLGYKTFYFTKKVEIPTLTGRVDRDYDVPLASRYKCLPI